jgi:hypothetical protein
VRGLKPLERGANKRDQRRLRDQGSIPDLPPELTANVSRIEHGLPRSREEEFRQAGNTRGDTHRSNVLGAFVGKFMDQEWDLRGNCTAIF